MKIPIDHNTATRRSQIGKKSHEQTGDARQYRRMDDDMLM
jgi:hypothetical protein